MKTQGRVKSAIHTPRREASEGTSPAHILIWDLQPPDCGALLGQPEQRTTNTRVLQLWARPAASVDVRGGWPASWLSGPCGLSLHKAGTHGPISQMRRTMTRKAKSLEVWLV